MTSYMDYKVSSKPIRIIDLKVDKRKLQHQSFIILDVGHIPGRIFYRRNARFINKWAIMYITSGSGTYQVNEGEVQQVKANSLFLFYPGAVFHFGPDPGGHWDEYFFTIEGPRIQELIDTWLLKPGTVKSVENDDGRQSKIERIFMLMDSGVPLYADRASLLLESLLFEFMMSQTEYPGHSHNELSIRILSDIADHLYDPFDPLHLCEKHHISLSTLKRIISKYTGYPLHEYVHRLKVAEAKNILLNSGETLKEIAGALGYKDVFYFSRIFKKFVGISPDIYRRTR